MIINSPTELVFRDLFYHLDDFANGHEVFLKLEGLHITGSIKFKTAMGLIEDLERRGVANPKETTLIESSSGNLGIALSLVCAAKGYRFICVTDPKANSSNVKGMQLYGAEVIIVDKEDPVDGYLGTRLKTIQKLLDTEPNSIWLNQYANPAAMNVHAEQTANEIIDEFDKVDWMFIGSGTTGTITGVAKGLRKAFPNIKIVAVEPEGSVTFGGESKKRNIPGIGTSVRPPLADNIVPDHIVRVTEPQTVQSCLDFVHNYHLLVGGSTGAVLEAIKQKASEFVPGETIVAISPDLGEKYLETIYEPSWVTANIDNILPNLDDADVAWFASTGRQQTIEEGEILITAGQPVDSLYILLEGDLSVVLGSDQVIAKLEAGDIIGEMSLIEKRLPSVSVVCGKGARVLAIPHSQMRDRLDTDSAFAVRFYEAFSVYLSNRLRTTMSRLSNRGVTSYELEAAPDPNAPPQVVHDRMQRLLARLESGK